MKKIIFYSYLKCSTCRKAAKWLENKAFEYQLVDIVKEPPLLKYINDDGMDVYYSKFNIPLLHELNDLAVEIKEETQTKLDIEFEPDTTIGSVS